VLAKQAALKAVRRQLHRKRRVDTIDLTASAHVRHTSFCG
jgi:hypothetical protein